MQSQELAARQSLIDHCCAMNASGLSLGKSGNASLRWGRGLLITPTGRDYNRLVPEDVVYLEADGRCPPGQLLPSSEWHFHCDILRAYPEVGAVVHAHSTGFYPANTDTSDKPHHEAGGVSCQSERSTARSSSGRLSG